MSWKNEHPEHYHTERNILKECPFYDQKFIFSGNILVSYGKLLLMGSNYEEKLILIVYPPSTPYSIPKVFILNNSLTEEFVRSLSEKKIYEIPNALKDKVSFLYYRHQNPDGSICILEEQYQSNNIIPIYHIDDILERIIKWIRDGGSKSFEYDNEETEIFYHFPNRNDEISFILPEGFYSESLNKGIFYIRRVRTDIGIGVNILSFSDNNVVESIDFNNHPLLKLFGIECESNNLLFTDEKELQAKIAEGILIEGCYWKLSIEPKPFEETIDLLKILDENGYNAKEEILISDLFTKYLSKLKDSAYFAFLYQNRRSELEWIFFILTKKDNTDSIAFNANINDYDIRDIKTYFEKYNIQAIYSSKFTEEALLMRNSKVLDENIIRQSNVSIIGCGALGSEIADCIAKAGVKNIFLVDKDILKAENSIRHLLGYKFHGKRKTESLAVHLYFHNCFSNYHPLPFDVLNHDINEYLPGSTIGISSIAHDNTECYINQNAVRKDKIIFYSRLLRGGKAARIIRVIPGQDACLNCLALYSWNDDECFIKIKADPELGPIKTECQNPILPGSATDFKLVASITTKLVLDYIVNNAQSNNNWIYHTENLPGLKLKKNGMIDVKSFKIDPHEDCKICQKKK